MAEFAERYINPFTDYGFKRLFGEEPNKELLLDFLNVLLGEEQGKIVELTYLKGEQFGTKLEAQLYEDNLKYYRSLKNSLDTAKEEGKVEGREEGRGQREIEIAKELLKLGVEIEIIMKSTGLTKDQIKNLKTN